MSDDEGVFEVEKILDVRKIRGRPREFLIKWSGYDSDENTWEPEENIAAEDLVIDFLASRENDKTDEPEGGSPITKKQRRKSSPKPEPKKKQSPKSIFQPTLGKAVEEEKAVTSGDGDTIYVTKHPKMDEYQKKDDWTGLIDKIESVDSPYNDGKLRIVVLWKDGIRTAHPSQIVNKKAPSKIIEFYEKHLRFQEE